ncbi:D-amino-acid transaminase [Lentibacillus salicampi]|uniref:D-alanine aminotransferase n=1 Tax=Lentibacillus salicampi TaxID=175306 RepID=A0A4Y9AEA4_9BACI|nr:D-amino-acid transaminase [Lentibacillus salicampi]TFJ94218.1 D-amino-acid transaminase [Lentibacillus salicampi]
MSKMLYNDRIMERDNLIDIEDRGYQFGDGVYEVIGVYDGRPMMMGEHMERLERSARELRLMLPVSTAEIKNNLEKLVETNGLEEGIIYLQVSRGVGSREHAFPSPETPAVTVAYTREEKRESDVEDQGSTAVLAEDIRWLRCDIKTLNLLPNVMAKQKAVEKNAVEAILHRGDIITEASASNVFMVKGGELYTHPANNYILNGITRRKIIQLCDELDLEVNEQTYTVKDLLNADEVFVSATKLDIIPILQVDDHVIGDGKPGVITKQVLQAFRSLYQHNVKYKA